MFMSFAPLFLVENEVVGRVRRGGTAPGLIIVGEVVHVDVQLFKV